MAGEREREAIIVTNTQEVQMIGMKLLGLSAKY